MAEHLARVSRTYAIVVPMLPDPLADAVGVAYLLMRIVDTIEDDPRLSAEQRRQRFDRLEAALGGDEQAVRDLTEPLGNTPAEQALCRDAPHVLARVRALNPAYRVAVARCAQTMSDGVRRLMARSAERTMPYPAVSDLAELREYCYYVAGVVGEMLCEMMAHHRACATLRDRHELAVELGIGLQLVNILKDAAADSAHGRRYLPRIEEGGATADEVYRTTLCEARRCLQRGIDYVLALPPTAIGLRCFCGLPIAWGGLTLARAERSPTAAKIGRDEVRGAIDRFRALAGDDEGLREWLSAVVEAPRPAAKGVR